MSGSLVSTDDAGRSVFQTATNFQQVNDGNGYLRLFTVTPSQGTVAVTTYSPYLNAYLTDAADQFTYTGVDLSTWTG